MVQQQQLVTVGNQQDPSSSTTTNLPIDICIVDIIEVEPTMSGHTFQNSLFSEHINSSPSSLSSSSNPNPNNAFIEAENIDGSTLSLNDCVSIFQSLSSPPTTTNHHHTISGEQKDEGVTIECFSVPSSKSRPIEQSRRNTLQLLNIEKFHNSKTSSTPSSSTSTMSDHHEESFSIETLNSNNSSLQLDPPPTTPYSIGEYLKQQTTKQESMMENDDFQSPNSATTLLRPSFRDYNDAKASSNNNTSTFKQTENSIKNRHHPNNISTSSSISSILSQHSAIETTTSPIIQMEVLSIEDWKILQKNWRQSKGMRFLNSAASALLDISFVIGAALFIVGCGLLIASSEIYFFSGVLLFIIGSALFLIGPIGKLLIDVMNLIKHFRWERKVKEITQLQNESSKSLKDQMHELHQDISTYRPSDLPTLRLIFLELVNDTLLIIGGLTFTIGSSLYMLNPPFYVIIIAEANWSIGAISYLIVSIIQYAVKQVDIIKNAQPGTDINFKCFTFMSLDISAYLLNIASSLLFIIGSGCFLVNQRSLEITGEVIWSMGCLAMMIAILFNRIVWVRNTFYSQGAQ